MKQVDLKNLKEGMMVRLGNGRLRSVGLVIPRLDADDICVLFIGNKHPRHYNSCGMVLKGCGRNDIIEILDQVL